MGCENDREAHIVIVQVKNVTLYVFDIEFKGIEGLFGTI